MDVSVNERPFYADVLETLRVVVVGGIPVGILVVGVGSRLAMLALRLTSPDRVRGIESDDGFEIGRFTLSGSYNLVLIGGAIGIIGAVAYQAVAPWLLGPTWFRRLTVAAAAGVVVGSMLVEPGGVDFTFLKPTWFAVALFVALPFVFGLLIGPCVESVRRPESWTAKGRRAWLVPLVCIATVPLVAAFPMIVVAAGTVMWQALRRSGAIEYLRRAVLVGLVVRAAWLGVVGLGLAALLGDIGDLRT